MKLGTRGHDILTSNIDEMITYCQKYQIDGLHLALYKSFAAEFEDIKLMKQYITKLEAAGIEIFIHGAYFNMVHPDIKKQEAGINLFKTVATLACKSQCKLVGSETGSLNGDEWTYNQENHHPETIKMATNVIEKLAETNENIQVLIEPVYDHVIYNVHEGEKVHNNCGAQIILDLANLLMIDNYQDYLTIFENALKTYRDNIKIFHLKNFKMINGQKEYTRLDAGIIDYQKLIKLIKKYELDEVPLVIEDLTGLDLELSLEYIRSLEGK